jgi:hypothetical protein
LSRADNSVGVMKGIDIRRFVPLHLDALQRKDTLKRWLQDICADLKPIFWNQKIGLSRRTGMGISSGPPQPAAAEAVVDQLGKWWLKRPECVHLVVVPRLMTGRWRRALKRETDFYFRVDWDEVWPLKELNEPLLIFVIVPYRVK